MPTIARALVLALAVVGAALLMLASLRPALAHSDGHGAEHGLGHGTGHDAGHGTGHGESRAFAAGEPGDWGKTYRVIEITMREGSSSMTYSPDRIEVRKGEQVRFVLRNAGELAHELMIDSIENNARHKVAMERSPDMAHDDANGRRVAPKHSDDILWRFSRAGTYEFACLIPGHYEAGMKGIIIVR